MGLDRHEWWAHLQGPSLFMRSWNALRKSPDASVYTTAMRA